MCTYNCLLTNEPCIIKIKLINVHFSNDGKVIRRSTFGNKIFVGDNDYKVMGQYVFVTEYHRIDKLILKYLYDNADTYHTIKSILYYVQTKLDNMNIYNGFVRNRINGLEKYGLVNTTCYPITLTDKGKKLYLNKKYIWKLEY